MLAHRGKQFSLFNRINTQVGFHIQVQLQHIFWVAGFFGYHRDHFFGYGRFVQRGGFRGRGGRRSGRSRSRRYRRGGSRGRRAYGRGGSGAFGTGVGQRILNNRADGRIIFQLHAFLFGDVICIAHNRKQFRLFDRINTEVGFHIQVQLQHILRIAGFFGNDI